MKNIENNFDTEEFEAFNAFREDIGEKALTREQYMKSSALNHVVEENLVLIKYNEEENKSPRKAYKLY